MSMELKKYNTAGFYVAKGLLKKSDINSVNASLLRSVAAQLSLLGAPTCAIDLFSSLRELHARDIERYKKVVAALWRKSDVFDLMHSPAIRGFLREKFNWKETFLPGGQVILIMAEELKIPNGYFGLIPHQDFPSVQGSLDGVVVWLPLTDVDKGNYPLEVIPGSHQKGLLSMIDHGTSTSEVDPAAYDERKFIPVEVETGDVVFMSYFTIHRSCTVGTPGRCRIAVSTRFDNAYEPTYLERAYPTAYVRSVHREQYVVAFPTLEQVQKVFGNV